MTIDSTGVYAPNKNREGYRFVMRIKDDDILIRRVYGSEGIILEVNVEEGG